MIDIPGDITSTQLGETSFNGMFAHFSGDLEFAGDRDWFRLDLTQATTITFLANVVDSGGRTGDSTIVIRDAAGNEIAMNDDGIPGSTDSALTHTFAAGTFFIDVGSLAGITPGRYTIYAITNALAIINAGQSNLDDTISATTAGRYFGGRGDDTIALVTLGNEAYGGAGDDVLLGGTLDNILAGGQGNDDLRDLAGGNDILSGDAGDDFLEGGVGDDELFGGIGFDLLLGGAGEDVLRGGADGDQMTGGADSDLYFVDSIFDVVIETDANIGTGGNDVVVSEISYTLTANVENLILLNGFGNLNGTGNALVNSIQGNTANNILDGGNDAVTDHLLGDAGNDTYVLRNGTDTITETSGLDTITSTIARSLSSFTGVENLTLLGTANINGIGNNVANQIIGNSGANTLKGNAGNDTLQGGNGIDKLFGDAGHDILNGGRTRDILTGGTGRDKFDFDSFLDSKGALRDSITDFKRNQDQIDLSTIDANTKVGGNQKFKFIGDDSFNRVAGELNIRQVGNITKVEGDVNGDGRADFTIDVVGNHNLTAGDFLL